MFGKAPGSEHAFPCLRDIVARALFALQKITIPGLSVTLQNSCRRRPDLTVYFLHWTSIQRIFVEFSQISFCRMSQIFISPNVSILFSCRLCPDFYSHKIFPDFHSRQIFEGRILFQVWLGESFDTFSNQRGSLGRIFRCLYLER